MFSTNVANLGNYITEGDIVNKNCVVDCGYEGECHINLTNVGKTDSIITAGDKIVQAILIPISTVNTEEVTSLEELYKDSTSERGTGGFGSSGTK